MEQAPFQNMVEVKNFRDGLYSLLRAVEAPSAQALCDYQTPIYSIQASDGNVYEPFYTWYALSLSNDDRIVGYYAGYYNLIMQTNYMEMRLKEVLKNKADLLKEPDRFKAEDMMLVEQYIGEVKIMRALAYYRLMTRFTYRYTDEGSGLILLTEYKLDKKGKQVTQKEVYDYALRILDEAIAVMPADYTGLTDANIPLEIPKAFAHAVKARILLEMHKHAEVINEINQFIGNYPLKDISALDVNAKKQALEEIYVTETSSEIMCKLYASKNIGTSTGPFHGGLIYERNEYFIPQLVPSKYLLELYSQDGGNDVDDIRASVYLANAPHALWRGAPTTRVNKFIGNPAFKTNEFPNYQVSTHLFNVAEAYLMLAEAQAFSGDVAGTLATINMLRHARGMAATNDITSTEVGNPKQAQELVKRERLRELIGEGRHFTDLKRWGDPIDYAKYGQPQNEKVAAFVKKDRKDFRVDYDPNTQYGQMYAWEFPKNDLVVNENLKPNWGKK